MAADKIWRRFLPLFCILLWMAGKGPVCAQQTEPAPGQGPGPAGGGPQPGPNGGPSTPPQQSIPGGPSSHPEETEGPDGGDRNYYLTESASGGHFVQKLSCRTQKGVLRYEFVIEQRDSSGSWKPAENCSSETGQVEVSLEAGQYRYKVVLYNYLDVAEIEGPWNTIEVKKAYKPEISGISPRNLYYEDDNSGVFTIEGHDLQPGASFVLSKTNLLSGSSAVIGEVLDTSSDNTVVKVAFNLSELKTGSYRLTMTNPGGLSAEVDGIRVGFKKSYDLTVSAGYALPIPLNLPDFGRYFDLSQAFAGGAACRFVFLPYKNRYGYIGISLDAKLSYYDSASSALSMQGFLGRAALDIDFQKFIYKKSLLFEFYGGLGILAFPSMQYSIAGTGETDSLSTFYTGAQFGASLQYYVLKDLYISADISAMAAFMPNSATAFFIDPDLSIGYRF